MAPNDYDGRIITVPEGLVFVCKKSEWGSFGQDSRIRVAEIFDLIVLRSNEYVVITNEYGQAYTGSSTVTSIVANDYGHGVTLFSKSYSSTKRLAKWHRKAQEQGYRLRAECDTMEPVFGGKFDELRASEERIRALPPSDATKSAQESIRAARKSMLDALYAQQQATPDEIALAEALAVTQIAQDAEIRRLALEQAREELNTAPYTPSE